MYRVNIQFFGGYGRFGFDYCDSQRFNTYREAYNSVRRWRRLIARMNIDALPVHVTRY